MANRLHRTGGPAILKSRTGVGIIASAIRLSTVLDDYSRYILAWELCPGMQAVDVERTVQAALQASSLKAGQRPSILSDNGSAYVSRYLKEYLKGEGIDHVRSAPFHPMTQGKIER